MKKKNNSYRRPFDLELTLQKLILLVDIVTLFVEKSHRSPSELETRIAHRFPKPKDTVTLGQIKRNGARKTRTTIQKFIQWLRKGQKTGLLNWHIFRVLEVWRSLLGGVSHASA